MLRYNDIINVVGTTKNKNNIEIIINKSRLFLLFFPCPCAVVMKATYIRSCKQEMI